MKNKKVLIILCLTLLISVIGCSAVVKEYYDSGKLESEVSIDLPHLVVPMFVRERFLI